jgi:cytochrome c oxidase subunit 2
VEASQQQPRIGPNLGGFSERGMFAGAIFENNEENLAAWLRNPPGVKPGAKMPNLNLTSEQINALIEYLQSLE